jgi:hypothetical protein
MLGGPDEGVVCYCANNNTAWMHIICHRNVHNLHDTISIYMKKKITETLHDKSMLSTLNKGTVGASELKLQKMISQQLHVAMIGSPFSGIVFANQEAMSTSSNSRNKHFQSTLQLKWDRY